MAGQKNQKKELKSPILIRLVQINVEYEKEFIEIEKPLEEFEDDLFYSIDSDLELFPKSEVVVVYFKYRLEYNTEVFYELKTLHEYNVSGLLDLLIEENESYSLLNSVDIHLAKMSLAHTRGYHAFKIKNSKYPSLFIPFVDEKTLLESISIKVSE